MVSEVSRLFVGQDFDAIGSITVNGQTSAAVELDMESLEDKPWRKVKSMQHHYTCYGTFIEWLLEDFSFSNLYLQPGADITDYFNYGFSEDTWAAYCNRSYYVLRSFVLSSSHLQRLVDLKDFIFIIIIHTTHLISSQATPPSSK